MTQERRTLQQWDAAIRNVPTRPREWERLMALDDTRVTPARARARELATDVIGGLSQ